ncbi:MAG: DEAD/DEAH box helicase [Clostridiaceae bacterium]
MNSNIFLDGFMPIIRDWFLENIGQPSEPQARGWPEIASGRNVLLCAPTGSGKTFAAFLKCLDWIYTQKKPDTKNTGIRIVYVSPLKALNNDIYRNLELPIRGIRQLALKSGFVLPDIEVSVRTGDTPQKDRTRMLKNPPDILITTPESLYIMLTSESYRKLFLSTEYLIVDEIHSICANKRGVHLAVTMERLERIAGKPLKRIGLTATINPLEEAARFLSGNNVTHATFKASSETMDHEAVKEMVISPRDITIINCDRKRPFELTVSLPVRDLKMLPENSIWPAIYSELLTLIRAHRSTLIFVNNRRVAELVAAGLNSLVEEPFAKTHHGSISKEIRQELERQLKVGELSCLVATSSLELGIDIGSIDLVVQVSAPGSVSQVLQRIGRSGHRLDAESKGIIIPKTRGDLLGSSFVSYQAKRYEIENIKVSQNCLDILSQQITSISCEGEQGAAEIYEMILHAYPYRDLPWKQFEDVLLMLSDPSPEEAPGSVKPRIIYDRGSGKIRSTPSGRKMCLMNSGTIPDKGNYSVYMNDTGIKVGELQEEFVFESRLGERFFLGSTVWKLEKIEKDRVIVSPSNASGAKIPFWMGDQILRSYETGKKLGEFLDKLQKNYNGPDFMECMSTECGLDSTAAENLKYYIADQIAETGVLPGAGRIVCEHFSDEAGDTRMIIHSPFGGRIHAPLAVLLHSKLSRLLNCRMEYVYNNDGILLHLFGYTGKLSNIFSLIDRESLEDDIFELLPDAPLFNINLRYNLTRSLLVEMNGFGKRTPLWIQRLRCAEAAASVLSKPDHPTVVETYRECMNDIFDIKSLYELIEQIAAGRIRVVDVYTAKPSPFSSELLFNFWQIYQYAYDLPVAERRNQLLVNDRDFIQLAAGINGEYELIDPRAVKAVEKELHTYKYGRKLNGADELYYFLHSFGELKAEPYSTAVFSDVDSITAGSYLELLEKQRRIIRIQIDKSGDDYWIASEDFPLYCIVAGKEPENIPVIIGLPGEEAEAAAVELLSSYIFMQLPDAKNAAKRLIRRNVMCTGPFTAGDLSRKYIMKTGLINEAISEMVSSGEILKLKETDQEMDSIYCYRKVYERIRQKTVIMARSDIKPKAPEVYCSFLFKKHGLKEDVLLQDEKLPEVLKLLQGRYYPVSWWEDFILPSRIIKYDPKMLDYLCSTGMIQWAGRMYRSAREAAFFIASEDEEPATAAAFHGRTNLSDVSVSYETTSTSMEASVFTMDAFERELLETLETRGASFLKDLSKQMRLPPSDLLAKLERLVWSGIVTNDSFSVARYYLDSEKKNSPWMKYNTYPSMGRWYKTSLFIQNPALKNLQDYINELLDHYGIISKEIVNCDKGNYKWSDVYAWLKNNEFSSGIKRGFYVSGLSGIQYARDRDINMIRMQESEATADNYTTLCSCDPANPYRDIFSEAPGRSDPGMKSGAKISRHQGTAIVFRSGAPVLAIKEYGSTIQAFTEDPVILEKAASSFIHAFSARMLWTGRKNVFTEYWEESSANGSTCKIEDSPLYKKLQGLGFERGYSGMTLWRRST